jgi:endoglucanase
MIGNLTGSTRTSRPLAMAAVAAIVAVVGLGCGHQPDTTLHPDPPAITFSPGRHPFQHATLYLDTNTAGHRWQKTHNATWLDPITSQPQAHWLNGPPDLADVPGIATRAATRDELPVFVAYNIPNRGCTDYKQGAPDAGAYLTYVDSLIDALGPPRSVIVLEPDAVAADCYNTRRGHLLHQATQRLADAGHYVYLDAGHSRWRSTGEMAIRLLQSGIADAEGFAVNISNRQTTQDSYRWGLELSDLIGGREFIIDTSRNGVGPPPDDPNRDDEWCNPRHQALGTPPQTHTEQARLAALLWIKAPGESDGECGGEHTYLFSPTQARNLIIGTNRLPDQAREAAQSAQPTPNPETEHP